MEVADPAYRAAPGAADPPTYRMPSGREGVLQVFPPSVLKRNGTPPRLDCNAFFTGKSRDVVMPTT